MLIIVLILTTFVISHACTYSKFAKLAKLLLLLVFPLKGSNPSCGFAASEPESAQGSPALNGSSLALDLLFLGTTGRGGGPPWPFFGGKSGAGLPPDRAEKGSDEPNGSSAEVGFYRLDMVS